jgi:hypothetical protein
MVIEFANASVEFNGGEITITCNGVKSYKFYEGFESKPTPAALAKLKKLPFTLERALEAAGVQKA